MLHAASELKLDFIGDKNQAGVLHTFYDRPGVFCP
jgi:hypothetical protein